MAIASSILSLCRIIFRDSYFPRGSTEIAIFPQLRKSISLAYADALLRLRLRTWYKWSRHKSILSLRPIVCRDSHLTSGNTEIAIFSHNSLPCDSINDDRAKQTSFVCRDPYFPNNVFVGRERWDRDRPPSPARCWCGIWYSTRYLLKNSIFFIRVNYTRNSSHIVKWIKCACSGLNFAQLEYLFTIPYYVIIIMPGILNFFVVNLWTPGIIREIFCSPILATPK